MNYCAMQQYGNNVEMQINKLSKPKNTRHSLSAERALCCQFAYLHSILDVCRLCCVNKFNFIFTSRTED